MRFAVRVEIRPLAGVADPEGQTIERALPVLGFSGVESVHVGKLVDLVVEAPDEAAARASAEQMCARLLANPVIERAAVSLGPADAERAPDPERPAS